MESKFGSMLSRVGSYSTVSKVLRCKVYLLDDNGSIDIEFSKHDTGDTLLKQVCDVLSIEERDYFGLRFVDTNHLKYWLDPTKLVVRQVKNLQNLSLLLRIKFYPQDVSIIKEEYTRYMFVQQLRRDIRHGRLYCPPKEAALLGAYLIQGVLGDYNANEHAGNNYVAQYKMFVNQTPRLEEEIAKIHQTLRGVLPAQADIKFLQIASSLETYGFYPFSVSAVQGDGEQLLLGIMPRGVVTYKSQTTMLDLQWSSIDKFDYSGKEFFIHLNEGAEPPLANGLLKNGSGSALTKKKKHHKSSAVYAFNCPAATYCKQLWKYALAQKAFFTCQKASEVRSQVSKRQMFQRRSTFRFSGKVFQELKEGQYSMPDREQPQFQRCLALSSSPRPLCNFKPVTCDFSEFDESAEMKYEEAADKLLGQRTDDQVDKATSECTTLLSNASAALTSTTNSVLTRQRRPPSSVEDSPLDDNISLDVNALKNTMPRDSSTPILSTDHVYLDESSSYHYGESDAAREMSCVVESSSSQEQLSNSPKWLGRTVCLTVFVSLVLFFYACWVKGGVHEARVTNTLCDYVKRSLRYQREALTHCQNYFLNWLDDWRSWYFGTTK